MVIQLRDFIKLVRDDLGWGSLLWRGAREGVLGRVSCGNLRHVIECCKEALRAV